MKNKLFSDKNGWIEIVEAFVAILLIVGVMLILISKGYIGKKDISEEVYKIEISILREIQRNDTLRSDILKAEGPLPIAWDSDEFPTGVKSKIRDRTPTYLECVGRICNIAGSCTLAEVEQTDIYAQSGLISSTLTEGDLYRRLNLFCWAAT